jgi:MATE family multidrug resistance protein
MMRRALALRHPADREIAALAVPALGALIADPLLSLIDTAFVGRLGGDALGALGVASVLFAVAFFVFNFLEYGTTSLIARAVGAGDPERAGRSVMLALVTAVAAGSAVAVLLAAAAGPLVRGIGASAGVAAEATTYVRIRALAAPALLVVRAGHGIYRGYQDTRTPLAVTLVVNAINLVLDPLLIFGLGWGVAGAAWATVAAQWAGAAGFALLVLGRHRERLGVTPARPRFSELRLFLRIGRDLAIRTGSILVAFTLAGVIATRVSDTAIAAHQVVMQLWIFLSLALDALAIAAQAMVGRLLGEDRPETAAAVADRLLILGVAVGAGLAALLVAIAPVVPGLFTDDPAVRAAIGSIYPFLVVQQPLNAAVFVWDGVFIGAGDFGYLAVAMLAAAAASLAVLAAVLPMGWGLAGVWWGITVLLIGRALTMGWRRVAPAGPLRRA